MEQAGGNNREEHHQEALNGDNAEGEGQEVVGEMPEQEEPAPGEGAPEGDPVVEPGGGEDDDGGQQGEADGGGGQEGAGGDVEGEEEGDSDDSDDEDGVQITIDHDKISDAVTKSSTTYQAFGGLGRGGPGAAGARLPPGAAEKKGKFAPEVFEQVGSINGAPAQEFDMEALEEKPWKKPGADITDYFNYGFTEETWNAYCTRQRKMRLGESGAGMPSNAAHNPIVTSKPPLGLDRGPPGDRGDHHHRGRGEGGPSASAPSAIPTVGAPPPKRPPSVLSRPPPMSRPPPGMPPPGPPPGPNEEFKPSSSSSSSSTPSAPAPIPTMTSDKRQFSKGGPSSSSSSLRGPMDIDLSRPPPGMPPPGMPPPTSRPPPGFDGPPPPPHHHGPPPPGPGDFPPDDPFGHGHEYDRYYGGYEPTMESQWAAPPSADRGGPPPADAPPGDPTYGDDHRDREPWRERGSGSRRGSSPPPPPRESRPESRYERSDRGEGRKRRRSRSRSRESRYSSRDHRSESRAESRRGSERSSSRRERSRSRSPSGGSSRHKRSKKEKRVKEEKDIKQERAEDE